MKRAKFVLVAVAVLIIAGVGLAFKSSKLQAGNVYFYSTGANPKFVLTSTVHYPDYPSAVPVSTSQIPTVYAPFFYTAQLSTATTTIAYETISE